MNRRVGFTLIELLVVAGIFSMLFALVLVGGRTSSTTKVRQSAQAIAAAFVQAQSRAMASDLGAGVILEAADDSVLAIRFGGILRDATPRPTLRGSGMLSVQSLTSAVLQSPVLYNEDVTALQDGYAIQFRDELNTQSRPTVFFQLGSQTGTTCPVSLRSSAGQSANNTIWPVSGAHEFSVPRYPSIGTLRFTLPRQIGVDLRFSGLGEDPYRTIVTGTTIAIGSFKDITTVAACFDRQGHLDSLATDVHSADATRAAVDPDANVYFLITELALIQDGIALRTDKSIWVVVKPETGRVSVAANVPVVIDEALIDPIKATDSQKVALRNALWTARGKARAGANVK